MRGGLLFIQLRFIIWLIDLSIKTIAHAKWHKPLQLKIRGKIRLKGFRAVEIKVIKGEKNYKLTGRQEKNIQWFFSQALQAILASQY